MKLEEIEIPEDEGDVKDLIVRRCGKEVILRDEHARWKHGKLQRHRTNSRIGYALIEKDTGVLYNLAYHDLQQLLIVG